MSKGIFFVLFMCISFYANAEVYKCQGAEVSDYFTDTACIDGEIKTVIHIPKTNVSTPSAVTESINTGYELFLGPERIGHEPEWTLAQAIEHLRWYQNKNERTKKSKGYFNGTAIILREKPSQ